MKSFRVFFFLLILLCVHIALQSSPTGKVYNIQLGAYKTTLEAEQKKAEFKNHGLDPVFIREDSETSYRYTVRWGHFPTLSQAWVFRLYFKEDLPQDADIRWYDWKGEVLSHPSAPTKPPLPEGALADVTPELRFQTDYETADPIPAEVQSLLEKDDLDSLTPEEIFLKGSHTGDLLEAIRILEQGIQKYDGGEWGAEMRLRLARKYLAKRQYDKCLELVNSVKSTAWPLFSSRARWVEAYILNSQGKTEEALDQFMNCVNDPVLPPRDRLDSAFRIAAIHHVKYQFYSSYMTYNQILQSSSAGNVKFFCEMELLGLEMELSRRGKGNLEECISLAGDILRRYQGKNVPPKISAVIQLMRLECHYWLKQYDQAISLAESLAEAFPLERREAFTALYWAGRACYDKGLNQEALDFFQKVEEAQLKDREVFPGLDIRDLAVKGRIRAKVKLSE